MQCYNFDIQKLRDECNGKQPSLKETSGILTDAIKELLIPSISNERVTKMFRDYQEKYRNIVKTVNKPSMTDVFKKSCQIFRNMLRKRCLILQPASASI